jgi:MarR family transcriptional regulator, organic hydroperoxide resistance regulator
LADEFTDYLCYKIGAAGRKIQRYYNNRLAEHGITIGQSFILLSLREKDGQNVKELAENLAIDSSAITGLVDRLEKAGLVERRADERDRRALRIHLTKKGTKLVNKMVTLGNQFNEGLKEGLSKSELSALEKFFLIIDKLEA